MLVSVLASVAAAQIATDGSLGPAQSLSGAQVTISPTLGQTRGTNLFHSFSQFNVNSGQTVTFVGDAGAPISNVLARVTGGSATQINGTLRNAAGASTLYLINASGILIGPGAVLDSPGGLVLATAGIRHEDETIFHHTPAGNEVLSAAGPAAFGFLDSSAVTGDVSFRDVNVTLADRTDLLVLGRRVLLDRAEVNTRSGFVSFVGTASINDTLTIGDRLLINLPTDTTTVLPGGAVEVTASKINVNGDPAGRVLMRAQNIGLRESPIFAVAEGELDGSGVDLYAAGGKIELVRGTVGASTVGTGSAGVASMTADTVILRRGGYVRAFSGSEESAVDAVGGDAGDVVVRARVLRLSEGANMGAVSYTTGDVGRVTIDADVIDIDGSRTDPNVSRAGFYGDTVNQGNGDVRGGVTVRAQSISLRNGGQISSSTKGDGNAAGIVIDTETLSLTGRSTSIGANTTGAGRGGTIRINTRSLTLDNQATIASTGTDRGPGGSIEIQGLLSASLSNGSIIRADAQGPGQGGSVSLAGDAPIEIFTDSRISAASQTGDAGSIAIDAESLTMNQAEIDVSTISGTPGDVSIVTDASVQLRDSTIRASSPNAPGNLTITSPLVVFNRSEVFTEGLIDTGGGNIDVTSDLLLVSTDSTVDAVGELALTGLPDTDIAASLVVFRPGLASDAEILRFECTPLAMRSQSTFTVEPRGGLREKR